MSFIIIYQKQNSKIIKTYLQNQLYAKCAEVAKIKTAKLLFFKFQTISVINKISLKARRIENVLKSSFMSF